MADAVRSTGTVKWFNAYKGFGFIAPDNGGEDLFVHHTSIRSDGYRTLAEGQAVEFVVDYGEDGRTKAVDVIAQARSRRFAIGRGGSGRGFSGGRGRGSGYGGYGGYYGGGDGRDDGSGYGRSGGIGRRGGGGRYGGGRYDGRRYEYDGGRYDGGRYDGGRYDGGPECYNCGRMGHLARDCYQGASGGSRRRGGGNGGGGGGGGGGGCFNCGKEGHFARECPNIGK